MIANAEDVLEKFAQLSAIEKKKVVSRILRQSVDIETSELLDEELAIITENDFLGIGKNKVEGFVELVNEYHQFIEFKEDVSKDLLFKLQQDISKEQRNLQRLWEFYHKLILINRKANTPEHNDSRQMLAMGFDEWSKQRKASINSENADSEESKSDLWLLLFTKTSHEFKTALGNTKANIQWRTVGSRVSRYSVIYAFKQGASAEEIALRFSTLDLKQIYSVINAYLQNPKEFEDYFNEQLKQQDEQQRQIENRFSPVGIRQRLIERSQNKR